MQDPHVCLLARVVRAIVRHDNLSLALMLSVYKPSAWASVCCLLCHTSHPRAHQLGEVILQHVHCVLIAAVSAGCCKSPM